MRIAAESEEGLTEPGREVRGSRMLLWSEVVSRGRRLDSGLATISVLETVRW